MIFVYYVLSFAIWLGALPYLIYLSFKSKYSSSIPARFWLKNNKPLSQNGIWIHACSYGENVLANALIPYFDDVKKTVITNTGFELSNSVCETRYLPFEFFLPFWATKQKLLITLEAELWLGLFASAKAKGAKTALLNARLSEKSYPKYKRFSWYYKYLFSYVDLVIAQSEADKKRLESIGAKNVVAIGNLKSSIAPLPFRFYTKPQRFVVVAASTHSGEESLILDAFLKSRKTINNASLIIVPRHPERFEEVKKEAMEFAQTHNLSFCELNDNLDYDIVFVGKMGELINLYAISDCVLLGGGWANIGGHNPIEPASMNARIISGGKIHNHLETFANVENIVICEPEALALTLERAEQLQPCTLKKRDDLVKISAEILNELLQNNR
ncbi:MAG: 3-deoxy-D-manno-octulosonic-acid transferase transferase [Pseudomonadota bacterium]